MKMLILGATGPTGRLLVDVALRAGDSVTAFVRNPAGLGDTGRISSIGLRSIVHKEVMATSGLIPGVP